MILVRHDCDLAIVCVEARFAINLLFNDAYCQPSV